MRADQEAVIDLMNENTRLKATMESLVKALERMCLVVDAHARREGLSRHYAAPDGPVGQARAALSAAKGEA